MKINELPDDQSLWLVKWIDRYKLPHLTTRSASVCLLLQQLKQVDMASVAKLTTNEVAEILGTPPKSRQATAESPPAGAVEFRECLIQASTLPLVHSGFIFKAKELVGVLPGKSYVLKLPAGRLDSTLQHVSDSSPPPRGWDTNFPHFALNNYELAEVKRRFPRSQFYIYHDTDVDFIVPCQVIFQTFYAPDTQMARAFTSGPWHETAKQAIYFGETKGGLRTCIPEGIRQWNIIIETRVKDMFARHLAILWWDEYAKACAEEIYARAIQERGPNITGSWHSRAKLPFSNKSPIRLQFVGCQLRQWSPQENNARARILVTRIIGSEEPFYIPPIHWQRVNSGEKGMERVIEDAAAPYQDTQETDEFDRPDEHSTVSANRDASAKTTLQSLGIATFGWKYPKEMTKLKKQKSGVYEQGGIGSSDIQENSSTGVVNYQNDSLGQLEAHVLIRDAVNRFTHLLEALLMLKEQDKIDDYFVIPPESTSILELRGELSCWNFLTDVERSSGKIAKRGWHILRDAASKGNREGLKKRPEIRTALIVEILIKGEKLYWIEIECKVNEAFRSPVIALIDSPGESYFIDVLQGIALAKGVGVDKKIPPLMKEIGGNMACYRHCYHSQNSANLDMPSINRFLLKKIGLS